MIFLLIVAGLLWSRKVLYQHAMPSCDRTQGLARTPGASLRRGTIWRVPTCTASDSSGTGYRYVAIING